MPKPIKALTEAQWAALEHLFEADPELRLRAEALRPRPDSTELKEMDEITFESHYAATVQRASRLGSRPLPQRPAAAPVESATVSTQALKEMDDTEFHGHYASKIMSARQAR